MMSDCPYSETEIERAQNRLLRALLGNDAPADALDVDGQATEIVPVVIPPENALAIFSGAFSKTIGPLIAPIERAVKAFQSRPPSVETDEGRKAVAGFAYKLARSKSALDDAGKCVNDELKRLPKLVDANRKQARDLIEGWQAEVRRPLDEWEARETERKHRHVAAIAGIRRLPDAAAQKASGEIRLVINQTEAMEFWPHVCEEFEEEYRIARSEALGRLWPALAVREAWEAQEIELAHLRAAEAEQKAKERAQAEALAEAQRKIEAAEAAARAAIEKTAQLEREAIAAETHRREIEIEARLNEARRQAEEADHFAAEEAGRVERLARADTIRAEAEAGMVEVLADIMTFGKRGQIARTIVSAIAAGRVAHIKLSQ